jgi:hypothetical protein
MSSRLQITLVPSLSFGMLLIMASWFAFSTRPIGKDFIFTRHLSSAAAENAANKRYVNGKTDSTADSDSVIYENHRNRVRDHKHRFPLFSSVLELGEIMKIVPAISGRSNCAVTVPAPAGSAGL